MKHVQWLIVSARIEDGYVQMSVNGMKAEQEYIIDHEYRYQNSAMIRVGTLVEPSFRMALRDLRDAIYWEIVRPILDWMTGERREEQNADQDRVVY